MSFLFACIIKDPFLQSDSNVRDVDCDSVVIDHLGQVVQN